MVFFSSSFKFPVAKFEFQVAKLDHMSTAVRNVVSAISVSNGKHQTSTPRARETLGSIIVILTSNDYVIRLINYPFFHYGIRYAVMAVGQMGDILQLCDFF